MPDYRLYHFRGTRINRAEHLTAEDDLKAIDKARSLVEGQVAELWRGPYKLKTFDPYVESESDE